MFHTRSIIMGSLALMLFFLLGSVVSAQGPTVQTTENASAGVILTDGNGMTLYLFLKDAPGVSNCVDECLDAWPPLLANDGPPVAGEGVSGELGVIDRGDGNMQVTYNGMPLYYFAKDSQAGDVNGQNVKDVWYVVHPSTSQMTVTDPKVNLTENADLGTILTSQGMTLYRFANDTNGVSACAGACAENWPPLLVNGGSVVAGEGVSGVLDTIERDDGGRQVTYNGLPLYFWVHDSVPGDTTGHGVKDVWFVVNPADTAATPSPAQLPATGGQQFPWILALMVLAGGSAIVGGVTLKFVKFD